MELNYNLFNSHIKDFDSSIYNEKSSKNNLENHFLFYQIYKKLIQSEIEKTKQLNAKFSKSLFEKNNKHNKINRNNSYGSEFKKVCSFESIDDEDERLNIIIRTYLNKISNDTFDKVSEQLIDKLLEIKNMNIFKILSEEIVNKCIYDNKYRNIYINLCSKIWNNKKIHYNLITIVKEEEFFYAVYQLEENITQKMGPFTDVEILKENVFKKLNFKNFFVDFIQELYLKKEINLEGLNDDDFFSTKKKTLLLVELLSILFINKHINFDIINIIIIDLLHQNDNFDDIKEIEFELLHIMLTFIFENNKTFKFYEQKKIIKQFEDILNNILKNNINHISKRSVFFIESNLFIFDKILKDEKYEPNNNFKNTDNTSKQDLLDMVKTNKIYYFKTTFMNQTLLIKKDIINILINKVLENPKLINEFNCLKEISNDFMLLLENDIFKIIENLDDIILDIPNIKNHIENLVDELKLNKNILVKLNDKIEELEELEDDDDDDDDFSFR
jgi:hypothetical protein